MTKINRRQRAIQRGVDKVYRRTDRTSVYNWRITLRARVSDFSGVNREKQAHDAIHAIARNLPDVIGTPDISPGHPSWYKFHRTFTVEIQCTGSRSTMIAALDGMSKIYQK